MELIKPFMLWGALAIVIPIVIHFWHQKRGKTMDWAATLWLTEKNQQQHRGLRLDNWVLLLLRSLLVILLAVLLSHPILHWPGSEPVIQKVHLVQPDAFIANNFRFELEEALKRGEKVYWLNAAVAPATTMASLPGQTDFNPLLVQTAVNQVSREDNKAAPVEVHLYVVNSQRLARVPFIRVPTRFRLHAVVDSARRPARPYLAAKGNKVFVNYSDKLVSRATDPAVRFAPAPAHTGSLQTLVDYRDQAQQQTVKAALSALADVYALDITLDEKRAGNKSYDWVLTDRAIEAPAPRTLYVVSGNAANKGAAGANVIYTAASLGDNALTPQASEMVGSGQLPEWLGERLVQHFGLQPTEGLLSEPQLKALFVASKPVAADHSDRKTQGILMLLFVGLIGLERWIALKKNA